MVKCSTCKHLNGSSVYPQRQLFDGSVVSVGECCHRVMDVQIEIWRFCGFHKPVEITSSPCRRHSDSQFLTQS